MSPFARTFAPMNLQVSGALVPASFSASRALSALVTRTSGVSDSRPCGIPPILGEKRILHASALFFSMACLCVSES